MGDDLSKLKPGSAEAVRLKEVLIEQNAWSQYLEVGIGPDAEVFTKAPRCPRSAPAWMPACIPNRPGTIPSRRCACGLEPRQHCRRRRSATMLICATSRGARRCCCQGQGQQRLLRGGPAAASVRRRVFAGGCPQVGNRIDREGAGRFRPQWSLVIGRISRDPTDLVARRSGRSINIPMASRCSSARCSRRCRIATHRARGLPTNTTTS